MTCGACTLCCKALEVHELRKPAGEWCIHCDRRGGGCRQYGSRPQSCRTFSCAWLASQITDRPLPAELRPDRSGVVLGALDTGEPVALVDKSRPQAWREGAMGAFLRGKPIAVMVNGRREGACE